MNGGMRRGARRAAERIAIWGLRGLVYLLLGAAAYVLGDLIWHGAGALSWEFLTAEPVDGGVRGGIFPAIVGTLWLVLGTAAVALPVGMAAAVYLSEYAREGRLTSWIRVAIVTLAGVPSVVFGLFGLGLFVIFFGFGASVLAGSLTLALLILPVIIVASEEALRAVPQSLREGSLALGATPWQTIWYNVLPCALPGMLTGSILGIARAAGETAPILFTAAAFYLPELPGSVFDQVMALPYHLYILATQHPDPAARPMQYGTALVLVGLVLGLNAFAILWRNRFRRRYRL
ncbi:MAG: phosphate ABC transporter, permease protein PstA [Planctomycetota bacterium]|nr:MAG: phosphate ABC transporter, permease protein PstA [Planctomycetota bacterium]